MSTITLSGTSFNCIMGISAFESLGESFTSFKKTTKGLQEALGTLKSKINIASVETNTESSGDSVQKIQARETTKCNSIFTAYEKLDTLIADIGNIDYKVSSKISSREDDFYKRYSYLKPECKKTNGEKLKDAAVDALKRYIQWKDISDWCKEHWKAIVTAIAVIVIAVVAAVLLGPLAVAAICSAIAFLCDAGDWVATLITGKDIYTLLKESGHTTFAEMFAGLKWGTTIAAVALSVVQLGKQISKVGLKSFHPMRSFLNGIKSDLDSVFLGKGLKFGDRLKAAFNIIVLNQSGDFSFKQSVFNYKNGDKVITAVKKLGFDDNNKLVIKSDFAAQALGGNVGDSVSTKKSSFLFDNTIDYNWADYGATKFAEVDVMQLYAKGELNDIINPNGSVDNDKLRKIIWKEAGVPSKGLSGGKTAHELYEIKGGKVAVYSVDSSIHSTSVFRHKGGVYHAAKIIESINTNTFAMREIMGVFRQIL